MNLPKSILMEAYSFFLKASQEGFDWDSSLEASMKVKEELEEVVEELHKPNTPIRYEALKEEIGDLFLACTCLARHCNVEPDEAISLGLKKFQERYMRFQSYANANGISLHDASKTELAAIWQIAKQDPSQEN